MGVLHQNRLFMEVRNGRFISGLFFWLLQRCGNGFFERLQRGLAHQTGQIGAGEILRQLCQFGAADVGGQLRFGLRQ